MKRGVKNRATVRLRMLLFVLLTLGTIILTAVLMFSYSSSMKKQNLATLVQLGEAVSGSAASLAVDFIIEEDYAGLDEICLGNTDNPSIVTARIADTQGKIIADSSARTLGQVFPGLPLSRQKGEAPFLSVQQHKQSLLLTRAVEFEENVFGYILLKISKEQMIDHLRQEQRSILLIGAFFCCTGLVISWFLALWLIRPLEQMTVMVENISMGKAAVGIKPSGIREIEHLAGAFLRMGEKVGRREKALLASEKQYRDIFENALEGIFQTTAEGYFTNVNPRMATLLGYSSPEELIAAIGGLGDQLLVSTRDWHRLFSLLKEQGGVVQHEVRLIGKEQQVIWGSLNVQTIYDENGIITGFEGLLEDITGQKASEQERLKLEKLESLGTLAGGIAHDFNNILAAILGNINMALHDGKLDEKTVQYLESAEKASCRAKGLTSQLLTFAKGGDPVKEAASIDEMVRDSAGFVLHGSNVSCTYQIPDDLWLVDVDKGQISQVIQNLVINADHAMPIGGDITICCENCSVDVIKEEFVKTSERYVKISVSDTGIGIPANVLDQIFDPYFSTKQQGSGLGLSICHSILAKHGGNITVQSVPGIFSTFTLYLPASKSQQLEISSQGEEEVANPEHRARIMIMDDEEMVRDITRVMLETLGHEVVLACDGEEAIALFTRYRDEGNPLDVIIMDLTIPGGMGGKEAVGKILAIDPAARVIVSSGYSGDPVMANCQEYGFAVAMGKPFLLQDLAQGIEQCLQSGS